MSGLLLNLPHCSGRNVSGMNIMALRKRRSRSLRKRKASKVRRLTPRQSWWGAEAHNLRPEP